MSSGRDFIRMIAELFIVCGLAAGSLAMVNMVTKEPIAKWETRQKEEALKKIFADADEFVAVETGMIWEARCKGQKTGNAFLAQIQGYSGPITLMFGTDSSGALVMVQVIGQTETPGLGAKITTPRFRDQFKSLTIRDLALKKDDPANGKVDAITGATISSRAVTKGIRKTFEEFNKDSGNGK